MPGPFDHLIGELEPGDKGWLPLDESGTPSGPATHNPPVGDNQTPALACAVMATSQTEVDEGDDALVTSTGATLSPPLTSNIDNRPPGWEAPMPPVIDSLTPSSCALGDPDFELIVTGTGFNSSSVIHFAGHDEPTDHLPDGTLSTGVTPSLWATPVTVEVYVHNDGVSSNIKSNIMPFDFTAPARSTSGGRKDGDNRRPEEAGRGAKTPGRGPKAPGRGDA